MTQLTRRDFLHASTLAGAGLALPGRWLAQTPPPAATVTHWDGSPQGRILLDVMTVYTEPSWKSKSAGKVFYWNDVVPVLDAVTGEGLYHTNHTWLKVDGGYIYSSWVQPVADQPNNPALDPGAGGRWGMVSVPITWARSGPGDDYYGRHRVYYSQVGRVTALENGYYKISEIYGGSYWVRADYVRLIAPEEIVPISGHLAPADKRIEITVGDQTLRAFEGEDVVYTATISSGVPESQTPFGEYAVRDKRLGQRMVGGKTGGGYNLPGVPWICYFTTSWIATHGTYWHNDYGRRHSNGCVNLHPRDALWLFRWTTPVADYYSYNSVATAEQPGTRITIKW